MFKERWWWLRWIMCCCGQRIVVEREGMDDASFGSHVVVKSEMVGDAS